MGNPTNEFTFKTLLSKKEYDKLNSYFCGIRNMKKIPDAKNACTL